MEIDQQTFRFRADEIIVKVENDEDFSYHTYNTETLQYCSSGPWKNSLIDEIIVKIEEEDDNKDDFEDYNKKGEIEDEEEANVKNTGIDGSDNTRLQANHPKLQETLRLSKPSRVSKSTSQEEKSFVSNQQRDYTEGFADTPVCNNALTAKNCRTDAEEKPYQCNTCLKRFANHWHWSRHLRTHTGERPHKCDVCGQAFNDASTLRVHKRKHTGERPYQCNICGKTFVQSSNLHNHLRTHTGKKPHECNVCGKGFLKTNTLKSHLHTHGVKIYRCDVCGKDFSTLCDFKRHSLIHTGEKPYKCDVCGNLFVNSGNLKVHIRTHTGEKPF